MALLSAPPPFPFEPNISISYVPDKERVCFLVQDSAEDYICSLQPRLNLNLISLQHFQDGAVGGTGANATNRAVPASKSACAYASALHRPTRPFVSVRVLGRVLKQGNVTLTIVEVCQQPVNFCNNQGIMVGDLFLAV